MELVKGTSTSVFEFAYEFDEFFTGSLINLGLKFRLGYEKLRKIYCFIKPVKCGFLIQYLKQ
jgi:hypothetical protein